MISKEKPVMLASSSEKADLDRLMLIWANRFPGIPENVDLIKYEYFAAKTVGMALSSVQGAVITKKYICGGYQAEYSFEIHYQIAPPGKSDDTRLKAVETSAFASYLGATSDQYEDYMVPLKLIYEVNV